MEQKHCLKKFENVRVFIAWCYLQKAVQMGTVLPLWFAPGARLVRIWLEIQVNLDSVLLLKFLWSHYV